MNIIYSFNKKGYEAACWEKEIKAASNEQFTFFPFNHVSYLDPILYWDAVKLDKLYQERHPGLLRMYADLEACVHEYKTDAIIVTNCPPYHPDFLRNLSIYKILYSGDDPGATYMRNIPYLHAYNHVFYAAPAYSADMDMEEKMRYCGMINADWLPLGVFDFEFDPTLTEETFLARERDIDIIYIGSFFKQKLETLAKVKRAFGRHFHLNGFFRLKHNLYFNLKYGYLGWVKHVSFKKRLLLYQHAKIGFNIHWNEYGLGNQRLYHTPANGVMQICDCPSHLDQIFKSGEEVIAYKNADDLIDKLRYYLKYEYERKEIALRGYRRTMNEYRFATVTRKAGKLIQDGMQRISWLG